MLVKRNLLNPCLWLEEMDLIFRLYSMIIESLLERTQD